MFRINGKQWKIVLVSESNTLLTRSDGSQTVGMCDRQTYTIYLWKGLHGAFLRRVLAHELCHAFCLSYGVYMPIEQEEYLADWISLYGAELVYLLDEILSNNILHKVG